MRAASGKRGALEDNITSISSEYGIERRTLEKWIQWPRLNAAGEYMFAPSRELIDAMAKVIAERLYSPDG